MRQDTVRQNLEQTDPFGVHTKRLQAIGALLPETSVLADIGADHARLLTDLVQSGKIEKGIGVEVVRGPYERAKANVAALGLEDKIEIRLGDGLAPLAQGEAGACAIAGMGGKTITDILARSPEKAKGFSHLLLQPMNGEGAVRRYLQQRGWRICKEAIAEERGLLYAILLCAPGKMAPLSREEAEFGPLLLKERPPLLEGLIKQRISGLRGIIPQLDKAQAQKGILRRKELEELAAAWEALLQ